MTRTGLLIAALATPLLLVPPAAAAETFADDCTAAARDTPTLDPAKLPDAQFRMVDSDIGFQRGMLDEEIVLKLRHGEETATLRSGAKLHVILGGCEDYANRYVFELTGDLTPLSNNRYWLHKASELIAEVAPANREGFVDLRRLSKTLTGAATRASPHGDLTEGFEGQMDETHRYVVSVSREGLKTLLRVSYIIQL